MWLHTIQHQCWGHAGSDLLCSHIWKGTLGTEPSPQLLNEELALVLQLLHLLVRVLWESRGEGSSLKSSPLKAKCHGYMALPENA